MAQLCQYRQALAEVRARVFLIGFSLPVLARRWREETCSHFQLLLDPERRVYRAYGLTRSWLRSWNIRTIWRYIQLLRQGRAWKGIQGDSAQLGGDFLVDGSGMIRVVHRSRDPTDRPSVQSLIELLREPDREG